MTRSQAQSIRWIVLGAGICLLAGAGAAYWFLSQNRPNGMTLPAGVTVMPPNTLMALSLTTQDQPWQQLQAFGTPEAQALMAQNLEQARDRLLTRQGFSYEQQIRPWVGSEITFGLLDAPTAAANPDASQVMVAVFPIAKPAEAQRVLEAAAAKQTQLKTRTYKGLQVRESGEDTAQPFSATVLDQKFVVMTTSPQVTNQIIDTYKGQPSLASTPGYQQALNQVAVAQPLARLYVNLPETARLAAKNPKRPFPAQGLAQLQQSQGLVSAIAVQPEGLKIQSLAWLKPNSTKYKIDNKVLGMATRLPSDTWMMVSGNNLQQFWQQYRQGAIANPLLPMGPEQLKAGVKSTTGLDIDKDLAAWMGGEFALALVPSPPAPNANLPAGLVLMVQTSDRRAAETALKQLDQSMQERYGFKVNSTQVGNQPVVNWTVPQGGPLVTRGWLDNNVAFVTLGAPITPELVPKPQTTLRESDLFAQGVPGSQQPQNGTLFVNVDRLLGSNLALLQFPPPARAILSSIRSVGITTTIPNDQSLRYDTFLALKKGNQPSSPPSPSSQP